MGALEGVYVPSANHLTRETVVEMAKSMTYGKEHPIVRIIDKVYKRGVTVSDQVMQSFEQRLKRKSGIEKYALTIPPS